MTPKTLFDKIQKYIHQHPTASSDDIVNSLGCRHIDATFYSIIVRTGTPFQKEYIQNLLQQQAIEKKSRTKKPSDTIQKPEMPGKRKKRERIEKIQQLLLEDNLAEIYQLYPSSPSTFYMYCRKHDIVIPKTLTPIRLNPSIDILIEQGASQEDIGASKHNTKEWARQYIMGAGWHTTWLQKREEQTKKYNTEVQSNLVSLLCQRMTQLAKKDSWSIQKAVEHFLLTKNYANVKPFSSYLALFETYEQAQQQGEKLPLQELATQAGFSRTALRKILKNMNLKPMFGNYVHSSKHKLNAMERGAKIGLSGRDVSYFLDIHFKNASNYIYIHYGSSSPTTIVKVNYISLGHKEKCNLHFSIASEIFEAHDAGFSLEDIRHLIKGKSIGGSGYGLPVIQELLNSRPEIEPTLITILQQLYNKPDLDKPYKINF